MTVIDVKPIVLKDASLKVAADNYENHVSSIVLTPNSSTQTWRGIGKGASFTDVSQPTWTAAVEYAQDWETDDSLARYLFEHQGETVTAIFQPKKGTGLPTVTVDLVITPGPIGGAVDTWMSGSVTLGVSGEPDLGVAA